MFVKVAQITCFLLIGLSPALKAQKLAGFVQDKLSGLPVPNAILKLGDRQFPANEYGGFNIENATNEPALVVSFTGYKSHYYLIDQQSYKGSIKIYLMPLEYKIEGITISGNGSKLDSLNEAYRNGLSARPRFKDIFVENSRNEAPAGRPQINSTAQLVTVDLLKIAGLLAKKDKRTRSDKRLLQAEDERYTDNRFNSVAAQVTRLPADSLRAFIIQFRPEAGALRKMNEYDLVNYISRSLATFRRTIR